MYNQMRLKSPGGTTAVNFAAESFTKPYRKKETRYEAQTAALYIHEWGSKSLHELNVRFMTTAQHSTLFSWWNTKATLSFIPDVVNASTVSETVRIINEVNPLETFVFKEYYEGTLIVRES